MINSAEACPDVRHIWRVLKEDSCYQACEYLLRRLPFPLLGVFLSPRPKGATHQFAHHCAISLLFEENKRRFAASVCIVSRAEEESQRAAIFPPRSFALDDCGGFDVQNASPLI